MGKQELASQAQAWAVALNIVYGTLGFGAMGFAIDHFAGTGPLWLLIMLGVGLVVGTYRFIREALALNKASGSVLESEDDENGEKRAESEG